MQNPTYLHLPLKIDTWSAQNDSYFTFTLKTETKIFLFYFPPSSANNIMQKLHDRKKMLDLKI